jgi:hypothetical protein
MILIDKFGEKLDLSYLTLEESDLMSMKLNEILELCRKPKIDLDRLEAEEAKKIEMYQEQFKYLTLKVEQKIEFYLDLCHKAQVRIFVQCRDLVSEQVLKEKTDNYPGLGIQYKSACNLKTPDYIYALMQQIVLKQREINRSLAGAISRSETKEFSYEELQRLDSGASALALQRAFMQVSEVLANNKRPDSFTDEFFIISKDERDLRAVFISVGKRNNQKPNLNEVKRKIKNDQTLSGNRQLSDNQIFLDPRSEQYLEAEAKVNFNCGSIGGEPAPIIAKVPYFLRSYIIKFNT